MDASGRIRPAGIKRAWPQRRPAGRAARGIRPRPGSAAPGPCSQLRLYLIAEALRLYYSILAAFEPLPIHSAADWYCLAIHGRYPIFDRRVSGPRRRRRQIRNVGEPAWTQIRGGAANPNSFLIAWLHRRKTEKTRLIEDVPSVFFRFASFDSRFLAHTNSAANATHSPAKNARHQRPGYGLRATASVAK